MNGWLFYRLMCECMDAKLIGYRIDAQVKGWMHVLAKKALMDGWMDGWIDEWMDWKIRMNVLNIACSGVGIGNMDKPINEWIKEYINEWMNKWMYQWMNECMNEWMNEWMGWKTNWLTNTLLLHFYIHHTHPWNENHF